MEFKNIEEIIKRSQFFDQNDKELIKNDGVVFTGILVDIKEECFDIFIETITSDDFYNYCELNNKTLKDKNGSNDLWLSITTTIRNYMY